MGCVVNGPGEAREADIRIDRGRTRPRKNFPEWENVGTYDEKDLLPALLNEVSKMTGERTPQI